MGRRRERGRDREEVMVTFSVHQKLIKSTTNEVLALTEAISPSTLIFATIATCKGG